MKRTLLLLCVVISIVFCGCIEKKPKTGFDALSFHQYLDGGSSTVGVILCHDQGQSSNGTIVGPLRKVIHKELGYHTLSITMPIKSGAADKQLDKYPEAYKRIQAAVDILKEEKMVDTFYFIGHGIGANMISGYLKNYNTQSVKGFAGMGMRGFPDGDLNTTANINTILSNVSMLKVLDIYGDRGGKFVYLSKDNAHAERRKGLNHHKGFEQVLIKDANHNFTGHDKELGEIITLWMKE